ncbi:MAG: hypothetical protein PHY72_02690 [Candidatus Pacebacteria bacterium]|nr:hypothetical protein [Candidatus Paceibacterota bacterium]
MLSNTQIEKFQKIYESHFGKTISRNEAYEKGVALLRLVELTYRPMTEAEYKQIQKRRKETGDL